MAINSIVSSESITVFGPPEIIEIGLDVGAPGPRGSYIYSGVGNPTINTGAFVNQPPIIGDLYIRTDFGSNYGLVYQYNFTPSGNEWQSIVEFEIAIDEAKELYDSAALLSSSAIYYSNLAEFYADAASANYFSASSQIIMAASAATTEYLIDNAPSTLDTLNELAAALNDDENFASTISNTYLTQSSASSTYYPLNANINNQTSSYIIQLTDSGKIVEMESSSVNTLTVPPESSVNFSIGTVLDIVQYGSGQTTIVAGSGVTIRSKNNNLKLTAQYSGASLYKKSSDLWVVVGDLSA
jgi:hypothetical protein